KNKLVLNDPGRLVVDLDKAVVGDKELLKPISVNQDNIRQVRVGQFDDQTVRIVIESKFPERLQLNYVGPDKALLAITASGVMATNTLPSDATLGTLKNILVSKERGDPVIRVNTTTPMVHRLIKDNGKLFLELANISGNPGWVGFDRAQFPQIDYMKVEPLTLGQPNSKLVVELKNGTDLDVASNMSVDGKTLEITLYPNPNAGYRSRSPWGDTIKAPFAARVVIDAGHGGKDLGANREGLNEKDLNLSVALKLKRALESRGVKVYMTRSTDQFLPLPQITQITNDIHPDLFVSVHTNSSTNPGITGLETYYYSPQSIALARRVHNRVVNNIASPDRGVRYARFYVIHHTPVPAILCEMGYISNASERADLFSEARKEKTANAIADGVVDYLRAALSANAKR
ncbi:MAG: N-acetylmuramoyl-L-alanine amidase, partial [Cyanobacteria bacterium]|nr:N-acetylmuramoyl-L-alanine amidase [Cyanobacteriota bacterium]